MVRATLNVNVQAVVYHGGVLAAGNNDPAIPDVIQENLAKINKIWDQCVLLLFVLTSVQNSNTYLNIYFNQILFVNIFIQIKAKLIFHILLK